MMMRKSVMRKYMGKLVKIRLFDGSEHFGMLSSFCGRTEASLLDSQGNRMAFKVRCGKRSIVSIEAVETNAEIGEAPIA